jgi:hypothetical protein
MGDSARGQKYEGPHDLQACYLGDISTAYSHRDVLARPRLDLGVVWRWWSLADASPTSAIGGTLLQPGGRGMQGQWTLPADVEAAMRWQMAEVRVDRSQ